MIVLNASTNFEHHIYNSHFNWNLKVIWFGCVGGDISYHLEKAGKFNVQRVCLYIAELSLALEYLRSKSIIHRDIKPANMLLDSQGHVHITDFNVAAIVRPDATITSVTGTKPYMGMLTYFAV